MLKNNRCRNYATDLLHFATLFLFRAKSRTYVPIIDFTMKCIFIFVSEEDAFSSIDKMLLRTWKEVLYRWQIGYYLL